MEVQVGESGGFYHTDPNTSSLTDFASLFNAELERDIRRTKWAGGTLNMMIDLLSVHLKHNPLTFICWPASVSACFLPYHTCILNWQQQTLPWNVMETDHLTQLTDKGFHGMAFCWC